METAPHAQDPEQKSNVWLHAQAERLKSTNVCVCTKYTGRSCLLLSPVLSALSSASLITGPASLVLSFINRPSLCFWLKSSSLLHPPTPSCNFSVCRGPSVLHLELHKRRLPLKTYTWSQPVSTASAQSVNYSCTQKAWLKINHLNCAH